MPDFRGIVFFALFGLVAFTVSVLAFVGWAGFHLVMMLLMYLGAS